MQRARSGLKRNLSFSRILGPHVTACGTTQFPGYNSTGYTITACELGRRATVTAPGPKKRTINRMSVDLPAPGAVMARD